MDIDRHWDSELLKAARTAVDEVEWLEIVRRIKTQVLTDLPQTPRAGEKGKGESR